MLLHAPAIVPHPRVGVTHSDPSPEYQFLDTSLGGAETCGFPRKTRSEIMGNLSPVGEGPG